MQDKVRGKVRPKERKPGYTWMRDPARMLTASKHGWCAPHVPQDSRAGQLPRQRPAHLLQLLHVADHVGAGGEDLHGSGAGSDPVHLGARCSEHVCVTHLRPPSLDTDWIPETGHVYHSCPGDRFI